MRLVDRVQAALKDAGLDIQVMELDESSKTAPLAAKAVGAPLGSIVKSLLFLADGRPILVLVAGDRRADDKLISQLVGISRKKLRLARPEEVIEITGYAVGGVPPVGHSPPLPTYIDESLSRFETVWAAAGASNAVFPIDYERLVEITNGRVAKVSEAEGRE